MSFSHNDIQHAEAIHELPPRFASIPVTVLANVAVRTISALHRGGIRNLHDLVGISAEDLAARCEFSSAVASEVLASVRPFTDGAVDPSLSLADLFEDDLQYLLMQAGEPDIDRVVGIFDLYYGFQNGTRGTLEEVGREFGVTRERIRQIRNHAELAVQNVLKWVNSRVLDVARLQLQKNGGLLQLDQLAAKVASEIDPGAYEPSRYLAWLIDLASDPTIRKTETNLVVGPPIGIPAWNTLRRALENLFETERLVSLEAIEECLHKTIPTLETAGREHYPRVLGDAFAREVLPQLFSRQQWERGDWAELILEQEGKPLHYANIASRAAELSGNPYPASGFNSLLNSDPRFVRVGAGDFALAGSGAEPYGRFDEVIKNYLEQRHEPAHEHEIIKDLLSIYTVAPTTVMAMLRLADADFVHFGGGFWGLSDRYYELDHELKNLIASLFQKENHAKTINEIRDQIIQHTDESSIPSSEEIERVLYVTRRFKRVGTASPAKFVKVQVRTSARPVPTRSKRAPDKSGRDVSGKSQRKTYLKELEALLKWL